MNYSSKKYDYTIEVIYLEDTLIIELYFQRSEEALTRSSEKYGGYCISPHTARKTGKQRYRPGRGCLLDSHLL